MGGTVSCNSTQGVGSTFRIELPVGRAGGGGMLKRRLLLVDDAELDREVLGRRLRRLGFEVEERASGGQVLPALGEHAYDCILLDVMLPEISGLQVLRLLRERHSAVELPVIMISARGDSTIMVEAFQCGANDYVTKPIDFEVMVARIEAQLARRVRPMVHDAEHTMVSSALPEPLAEELSAGTVVGSYTIRGRLGRGGMGTVYDAEQTRLHRAVALKLLNLNSQAMRLEREAARWRG